MRTTMRDVALAVAAVHRLTLRQLLSRSRTRELAWARQEAMWRMRAYYRADGHHRWSSPQIGRFFGRDHSTVLAGVRRYRQREFGPDVENLK